MRRAYVDTECRGCVCPRISRSCIDSRRIVDDDGVLCLGNNRGKEAVPLSFIEMGGLQYCECPTQFVFEDVNRFGSDDAVIFVMVSFWATSMSYAPFFDDFVDIVALSLLVEMEDARYC